MEIATKPNVRYWPKADMSAIDCKITGIGAMMLKSEFVKKA